MQTLKHVHTFMSGSEQVGQMFNQHIVLHTTYGAIWEFSGHVFGQT